MIGKRYSLGIVGMGPRGQYALECFVRALETAKPTLQVGIVLFEETDQLGNGPVWSVAQPESNWSNVTERILELPTRRQIDLGQVIIPEFPSYHEWANLVFDIWPADRIDTFPPRREIGRYLSERCRTLVEPLVSSGVATLVPQRVDEVAFEGGIVSITTSDGSTFFADQVLLTIGHQSTELDDQLQSFVDRAAASSQFKVYAEPYPVEAIAEETASQPRIDLAVRGFGLATIDVLRAVAEKHGTFVRKDDGTNDLCFRQEKGPKLRLVPFSLDGLPMGPKPLTPALDSIFAPSDKQLQKLTTALTDPARQQAATGEEFLLEQMVPLCASIFQSLENKCCTKDDTEIEGAIRAWIQDQFFSHPCILRADRPVLDLMADLVRIAIGDASVTLDYCVGQVWRHCQPVIYAALSHGELSDTVLAKIIELNEKLKRYSFGPPAESIQQIIALAEAGSVDLRFAHDPSIDVGTDCWILSNCSETFQAQIFTNAVLDPPDISVVNSKLVKALIDDGLFAQVHDNLGIFTDRDGFVLPPDDVEVPIAVLGRLAKGSVIGVDDIVVCFGERPERWAKAALARITRNQD